MTTETDNLVTEIEAARRCLADAERFLDGDNVEYGFADAYDTADMLAAALRGVLAALDCFEEETPC